MTIFDRDCPAIVRAGRLINFACFNFEIQFGNALAVLRAPALGTIVTLRVDRLDEDGDEMEADHNVVVLDVDEQGKPLVSYEHDDGHEGYAWLNCGEWYQRAE